MKVIQNVKDNKYTTGTGVAMIAVLSLKAFRVDLGEMVGMDTGTVILNLGAVVSAVLLLFAKDPVEKTKNK